MIEAALDKAILATIYYSDLFSFPLKEAEIEQYLYQYKVKPGQISSSLRQLNERGLLQKKEGFYFLTGRESIIRQRHERATASVVKRKKAEDMVRTLSFLPWLELVAITGSLAVNNSAKDDDIDLMLVTSPKRLWLTRLLIVSYLKIKGSYRSSRRIQDTFCPNLWLSREALDFEQQNIFVARELAQMLPLLDRGGCYQELLQENSWLLSFLPNWRPPVPKIQTDRQRDYLGQVGDALDRLAYIGQRIYMSRKKTVEKVNYKRAFFHPRDVSGSILKAFSSRWRRIEG